MARLDDGREGFTDRVPIPVAQAWGLVIVLLVPVLTVYAIHLIGIADGKTPTGFIQIDMPIYMAKAREYADHGFHWTYANPSNSVYGGPRIYFQPWSFALGCFHRITHWDVGAILVGFWFTSILGCAYIALRLYEDCVGLKAWPEKLGLLTFFWGGGVFAASGVLVSLLQNGTIDIHSKNLFQDDPGGGWWCLNFGRNLIYPTEAFYHLLFLACIRFTLNRSFASATLCATLTVASHPFTGLELTSILWTWLLVEVVFLQNREHVIPFFTAISVVLIALFAYYMGFLNLYPEHRIVARQMSVDWGGFKAINFIPAYALVASFAIWQLRNPRGKVVTLARTSNRLFLVWFLVAFALANHDSVIKPRQPIHFTRGYIWTALFFLGLPALLALFRRLMALSCRPVGVAILGAMLALLLSDNFFWFGQFAADYLEKGYVVGIRIPQEQREIYSFLSEPAQRRHILLCNDESVSYLATAYTPLQCWVSHHMETPEINDRRRELSEFFHNGVFQACWYEKPILVLLTVPEARSARVSDTAWAARYNLEPVFQNAFGRVYRRRPSPGHPYGRHPTKLQCLLRRMVLMTSR